MKILMMKMIMILLGGLLKMCKFYSNGVSYEIDCGRPEHGFAPRSGLEGSVGAVGYADNVNMESYTLAA